MIYKIITHFTSRVQIIQNTLRDCGTLFTALLSKICTFPCSSPSCKSLIVTSTSTIVGFIFVADNFGRFTNIFVGYEVRVYCRDP